MISKVFPHFGLMHFFIAFFFMNLKSSEVHINCISHSLMICHNMEVGNLSLYNLLNA
jgi:hypothetical protein